MIVFLGVIKEITPKSMIPPQVHEGVIGDYT
jgi:hypothetical protein